MTWLWLALALWGLTILGVLIFAWWLEGYVRTYGQCGGPPEERLPGQATPAGHV